MADFKHSPLKRHHALQPFSRDHYQGLVQAQHLIKSADGDAAARRKALAEFLDAWEREIEPHFRDEERLLTELAGEADRQRLLEEHSRLRGLAAEAREQRRKVDPDAAWVRGLGESLSAHIRWEERELFVAIESAADQGQLAELDGLTQQIESNRCRPRFQQHD